MSVRAKTAAAGARAGTVSARTIGEITTAPVKSLGLSHPGEVELKSACVPGDHEFFLVDERGRLFVIVRFGPLVQIQPELDGATLTLRFPEGAVVSGEVTLGESVATDFYGLRTVAGREVLGPFADAISSYAGTRVRLVRADHGDGYDVTPVTIISTASVGRLSAETGTPVDHRRFRMLFRVDGCEPHEEDTWGRVAIGDAIVRIGSQLGGPVPRCDVITRDPDTGRRDLDTLRLIKKYRGQSDAGIVFGVYATVEKPGLVRLGDRVEPLA
jgi:uncharacterized protein